MGIFSFFSPSLKGPKTTTDIVIVGGSYAGADLARQLATKIQGLARGDKGWNNVRIRVLEKRDSALHAMASPRAIVDPEFAKQVWVPLSNVFDGLKSSQFSVSTNTTVKTITDTKVITDKGEEIPFDYLVLATGSNNRSPAKLSHTSKSEGLKFQQDVAAKIAQAKTVLIVGGGAVAIETAGEIKTHHPNVKVVVVERGQSLLSGQRPKVDPRLAAAAKQRLEALGVEVILNDGVKIDKDTWTNSNWVGLDYKTFDLESGKQIDSDVQLIFTGNATFNSDLAKDLGIVTESGEIAVDKTYQVTGHPNIFSLGDVAKTGASKQVAILREQIPAVLDNILTLIDYEAKNLVGEEKNSEERIKLLKNAKDLKLKTFDNSSASPMIFISLGKGNGAIGQAGPLGVQTGRIGNMIGNSFKGDMMVGQIWKTFGFKGVQV